MIKFNFVTWRKILSENSKKLESTLGVSRQGESGPYILDPEANETPADVAGRSLAADPYRLLIRENGDGVMETVMVAVLGYRAGVVVAAQQGLARPEWADRGK